MKNSKLKNTVLISLCSVMLCLCSLISLPFPIPFTFQTFGIFFALCFLGGVRGTLSILVYIALGTLGLPVFSSFSGGLGTFLQPSGGFIIGFVFIGFIYALFTRLFGDKKSVRIISLGIGLCVCYLIGTVWFAILHANSTSWAGLISAFSVCVLPFIVPDVIKLALAVYLGKRIKNIFDKNILN